MKGLKAVVLLLTLLALGVCLPAHASDMDWSWRFGTAYFGTSSSASDNADTQDTLMASPQYWYMATYHETDVDGWTGDTGFYSTDTRSPLPLVAGQSKTWRFYVWKDLSSSGILEMMWGWSYPNAPAFDKMEYRLTYVRSANGVTEGSTPVGTSVLLNQYQQGTWSLPVYRTDDGRTGYMFEFSATVIPEPSSLLAVGGGLGAVGGLALRKRRR